MMHGRERSDCAFSNIRSFAEAMIDANPERLVGASDWPHQAAWPMGRHITPPRSSHSGKSTMRRCSVCLPIGVEIPFGIGASWSRTRPSFSASNDRSLSGSLA